MTSRLDRPILHLLGNLTVKHARRIFLRKVGMMPGVRLDADAPRTLGHAENEGPAVLRIEVGIGQHEEALVLL